MYLQYLYYNHKAMKQSACMSYYSIFIFFQLCDHTEIIFTFVTFLKAIPIINFSV